MTQHTTTPAAGRDDYVASRTIASSAPRGALCPSGWAPVVAAVVLLAGCAAPSGATTDTADQGYVSGDGSVRTWDPGDRPGPAVVTGTDFDDGAIDTADWAGDVVILNTWYAGCPPCRSEAPTLAALADELEDDGVRFLGINTEDEAPTAQAFERNFSVPYPSVQDNTGAVVARLSGTVPLQAVPSTIVLDTDHMVAARVIGEVDRSTLEALIQDVLGEGPPGDAG